MLPMVLLTPVRATIASTTSSGSSSFHTCKQVQHELVSTVGSGMDTEIAEIKLVLTVTLLPEMGCGHLADWV